MGLLVERASKSFPGVRALSGASLDLADGEIHALMGENGAGKSTLIKIVTGVHRPDSGRLVLHGQDVTFSSPRDAIKAGIAAVHQERNLIPRFSVAENLMLERLPKVRGLVDFAAVEREARAMLALVGLDIDPRLEVRHLSVAQMQMVEIAKALGHQARVLLLDEPTASISDKEAESLFSLVRQLKAQGTAILFVSHKLEEVLALCDRITVLRDGETTLSGASMQGMARGDLIEAMIGRKDRAVVIRHRDVSANPVVFETRNLATAFGHRQVDLSLRKGEILGLYGLVGAGRTELARALIGKEKVTAGTVAIKGQPVRIRSVEDAIRRHRLGYVSEDRKFEGVILGHSIRSNIAATVWNRIAGALGFITAGRENGIAAPLARQLEIRTPNLDQLAGNLSGGNQQKVSLAKWLAAKVDVLIIDEPTVGIDIKTKSYFHELITRLADEGLSIVLISSDMPEMVTLADRILVMHDKQIVAEIANDHDYDATSRSIMAAIHVHRAGGTGLPAA
jgi:ribose transport system ATP-binding protein